MQENQSKSVLKTPVKAQALWDHEAVEENEISCKAGDEILIREICNEDWYVGEVKESYGYLPANRVKLLEIPEYITSSSSAVSEGILPNQEMVANPDPIQELFDPTNGSYSPMKMLKNKANGSEALLLEKASASSLNKLNDLLKHLPSEADEQDTNHIDNLVAEEDHLSINLSEEELSLLSPTPVSPEDMYGKKHNFHIRRETDDCDIQNLTSTEEDSLYEMSSIKPIPIDIVKKEGHMFSKPDFYTEAKSKFSWKQFWAVLCPGILVLYKEAPAKATENLPSKPYHIIVLQDLKLTLTSKDDTKKKNAFVMNVKSGRWLFYCLSEKEAEKQSWMDALNSNSLEFVDKDRFQSIQDRIFDAHGMGKKQQNVRYQLGRTDSHYSSASQSSTKGMSSASVSKSAFSSPSITTDSDRDLSGKSKMKSKIGNFFSRKSISLVNAPNGNISSKAHQIISDDSVFGGYLEKQFVNLGAHCTIPPIVEKCILAIEQRGIHSEGIYRLSGQVAVINKLKNAFQNKAPIDLSNEDIDINAVAGVLKNIQDYDERMIQIKFLIHQLPLPNYNVLEYLCRHLSRIIQECDINKMQSSNIGIVFGPTLLRSGLQDGSDITNMIAQNMLIEAIVEQVQWVFEKD